MRMPSPPRTRVLAIAVTLAAIVGSTAIAAPKRWREIGSQLATRLEHELGLVRSSAEIHRGLAGLDRERNSLQYTAALLDHASSESMRRLSAYAEGSDDREVRLRQRGRALYKLARGGAARLAFGESLGDETPGATANRLARSRALRDIVRRDLDDMSSHRRARSRARDEMLAATRELTALATVSQVFTMQGEVLATATAAVDPAVGRAVVDRKLALRRTPTAARKAQRELVRLVKANWKELESLRGLDGAPRLHRPVSGNVVGRFGAYRDRVLGVPSMRNGVEMVAKRDERVVAMARGRVVLVTELPDYGNAVVIEHGGGQYTMTARLWKVAVESGTAIEPGDLIGMVGPKAIDDGLGNTVYVELRHGEKPIDPEPYLMRARAAKARAKAARGAKSVKDPFAADVVIEDDDDLGLDDDDDAPTDDAIGDTIEDAPAAPDEAAPTDTIALPW